MQALSTHHWPGNVRELKNLIERLVIMTPGERIDLAALPAELRGGGDSGEELRIALECDNYKQAREEFEKEFIRTKLEENDWNVSRTAEVIGLERSNLHRKIKSLGLELEKQ